MLLPLENITLIGAGTIGLSFCALHLRSSDTSKITIHDPREDLHTHVTTLLPSYLPPGFPTISTLLSSGRLVLADNLESACTPATHLVQEQGPESAAFKVPLWPRIEALVSAQCYLWSSTCSIPASTQSAQMREPGRLLIAQPFNPPHILPLIEIVPGPATSQYLVEVAKDYFERVGHSPVVVSKEKAGFVADRLAFALLREACSLVEEGVVGVRDVDRIIEASIGVRWGIKGPFGSCHDEGGVGGFRGFMQNVGSTVKEVWAEGLGGEDTRVGWEERIAQQIEEAYGNVTEENFVERDRITRKVLEAIRSEKDAIAREKIEAMRT